MTAPLQFKIQQVLRTKIPLKAEGDNQVSPGTRVVVMGMDTDGRARVKIVDPRHPNLSKVRLVAGVGAFNPTHRGRPAKSE